MIFISRIELGDLYQNQKYLFFNITYSINNSSRVLLKTLNKDKKLSIFNFLQITGQKELNLMAFDI